MLASEISTGSVVLAIVGSGALAGVVQTALSPVGLRFQHKYAMKAKAEEAEAAAQLRRLDAHERARDRYLPSAAAVHNWIDHVLYEVVGEQVGVYETEDWDGSLVGSDGSAAARLREIALEHPSAAVRQSAETLRAGIVNWYGEPQNFDPLDDDEYGEKLKVWREEAVQLIEALHVP